MASAIFFGGRRINIPGAYSNVDASQLAEQAAGAVGIVALIGTASGGEPLKDLDFTRAGSALETFRGGDLRAAAQFAFQPSNDEAIPGGAQRVVAVKVNPDEQAAFTFQDSEGNDTIDVTSRDWGEDQNQISIDVDDGTNQGKLITVGWQGEEEVFDDVGGDPILTASPSEDVPDSLGGALVWIGGAFKNEGTSLEHLLLTLLGSDSSDVTQPASESQITLTSASASDTQDATVYGEDASQEPIKETVTLDGTTGVTTSESFTKVHGVVLESEADGDITVEDSGPATILTISAGDQFVGARPPYDASYFNPQGKALTIQGSGDDGNADDSIIVFGTDEDGQLASEILYDLSSFTTTPLVTTTKWKSIEVITNGNVSKTSYVTVLFDFPFSSFDTIGKIQKDLENRINEADFTLDVPSSFPSSRLDHLNVGLTGVDLIDNAESGSQWGLSGPNDAQVFADTWAIIEKLNESSGFVEASFSDSSSKRIPENTISSVFLIGGEDGSPTITEWQKAFDILKKRRVNIIVPLTEDSAVHNLLVQHLKLRAGQLRSEANGYVGIGTDDGEGETKTNIKSQIQVLGTRHVTALSEECERFSPDDGQATWYPPYIYAAIAAGMQAGSPIGEPLTFKRPLITDVRRDSSWNPEDDSEEMIDAGLMFTESKDNVGLRFVRSITTHLIDDNKVFTEMSANESTNTAIFELRTALEARIGQRGLVGTVASIKGLANDVLSRLVDDNIIFAYRALAVEQIGDVFPVSVEIAPILPINFIPITVHLVAARAAA